MPAVSSFQQPSAPPGPAVPIEPVDAVACGRVVLWLGLLRRMRLRELVDVLLPTDSAVSHGEVVEVLVLNRLIAPRPLYQIAAWAHACGLAALTGRDPARFNDDRIGRTLDALADHVPDVQAALTTHVVTAFDVATADVHYDTTAAYLEGDYADSDLAARGHSKGGPAHHKQIMIGLVASTDGEIPLAHRTLPGNTGDVTTVPGALHDLRAAIATDPVVVSGDGVMWSQANMDAVAHARGIFLGPIAMSASVAAWVCATTPTTEVAVQLTRVGAPVLYRASVVSRFAVDGAADAGARLVVYDPRRAAAEVAERTAALARYEAALMAFTARLNRQKLKTLAAITKALTALATRHGLAARYVVPEIVGAVGSFAVRWQRADAALAAAAQRDGKWPLVTNKPGLSDADLCAWAVRRYKTHGRVERDMHLVKGPLRVRPLFVQNDDRIRSLVALCVWALTAWTLLERQGRRALPPTRPARPIVTRIEGVLGALMVLTLRVGTEGRLQRAISPVTAPMQSLLWALGWNREVRTLLDTAAEVRIQV